MTFNIKPRSVHHLFLILAWGMAVVSCTKNELEIEIVNKRSCEPLLTAVTFNASSNPYQLIVDARCEIIGDSMVECRVGHFLSDKELVPHFEFQGDCMYADGLPVKSTRKPNISGSPSRRTTTNGERSTRAHGRTMTSGAIT